MTLQANETGVVERHRGPYTLSTDRKRIGIDRVYRFLAGASYSARGVSREFVARSLAVGIYRIGDQVGFARVITNYTCLAYLDVIIDPAHRGCGLETRLTQMVRTHPDLASVMRWLSNTVDAHTAHKRAGFAPLAHPEWLMEVGAGVPCAESDVLPIENRK